MQLVDTHCHIQSAGAATGDSGTRELWAKDSGLSGEQLVARAVKAGVTGLICVGCDQADSELAVAFVQDKPNCWASIGIHPHEAQEAHGRKVPQFAALAIQPKVVAIGECGLDYYYEHSPRAQQIKILEFQMELALETGLPMIFHVRQAFKDFWPIYEAYGGKIPGVLHSFTDNPANLEKAVAHGLHLGVNGIATFAKDPQLMQVYRDIPLQKLLLETDAPFLTPTPYRGTINEPKRVGLVAEFLANLRGESLSELSRSTTQNAIALFGLK